MNTLEKPPLKINGKFYPLWSQFVHRKEEWIGKKLQDLDGGEINETIITNITLEPNGEKSAAFSVEGKDFGCGFDVQYGGVTGGEEGWLTFSGYGGHTWRIESTKNLSE